MCINWLYRSGPLLPPFTHDRKTSRGCHFINYSTDICSVKIEGTCWLHKLSGLYSMKCCWWRILNPRSVFQSFCSFDLMFSLSVLRPLYSSFVYLFNWGQGFSSRRKKTYICMMEYKWRPCTWGNSCNICTCRRCFIKKIDVYYRNTLNWATSA